MTEIFCNYSGDRDAAIVAFLYDDADESLAERARFDTHLERCARCQTDIAAFKGVRAQLARWSPPEPVFAITNPQLSANPQSFVKPQSSANPQSSADPQSNPQSAIHNPQSAWWRAVPAWAQVAAALLFLGVSAGIANLDIRYDHDGLSVRTGWSPRAGAADAAGTVAKAGKRDVSETLELIPGTNKVAPPAGMVPASRMAQGEVRSLVVADQSAPWRADLAALERQLKSELRASQASATAQTIRATSTTDTDVSRIRALLQESEKRQQRELALRIAELLRDVNAQRQADLVKIDRTLGVVTNNVGVEVMKNRQQMDQINLAYRASQRQ
jgi:hypothetical protein